MVTIADNGQGFDPQYAEQIIMPCKRLHGPDTLGSGIDLASCRLIVERLGGRIWAESALEKARRSGTPCPPTDPQLSPGQFLSD